MDLETQALSETGPTKARHLLTRSGNSQDTQTPTSRDRYINVNSSGSDTRLRNDKSSKSGQTLTRAPSNLGLCQKVCSNPWFMGVNPIQNYGPFWRHIAVRIQSNGKSCFISSEDFFCFIYKFSF